MVNRALTVNIEGVSRESLMAKIKSISISIPQAKEIVRFLAKFEEARCVGCPGHVHATGCPARRASQIQDLLRRSINNPTCRHTRFFGMLISDAKDTIGILDNYEQSLCQGCPGDDHQDRCPARNAYQLKTDLQFLIDTAQRA